jgi:hypothetical protein
MSIYDQTSTHREAKELFDKIMKNYLKDIYRLLRDAYKNYKSGNFQLLRMNMLLIEQEAEGMIEELEEYNKYRKIYD